MSKRKGKVSARRKPRGPTSRGKPAGRDPQIRLTARDKAAGEWFAKLVALQARLRGPGGCPWDAEQTHASLRKFLVEETYEALDAMDSEDRSKFASELGDVLLQVIFHGILAEEAGDFAISDVIESIHTKMVRRHPHVFGKASAKNSAEVLKKWEELKTEERIKEKEAAGGEASAETESVLAGVPRSLPAVLEAYQLTRRASHVGFDWETLGGIWEKLDEERGELDAAIASGNAKANLLEEEVGDLLFVGVNAARFLGVDPEVALRAANRKFKARFEWMEAAARREGRRFADLPRERMEELWEESKVAEGSAASSSGSKGRRAGAR
ncbi:MAG TPA: nucleoside triphosphate pyrophosphohydrolase [Candidatus Limnocylindrales bacterium]|nr:nucleoside triphosphate pyrophosphohydrolase [Candidatus Limnocylindrales bacterium]